MQPQYITIKDLFESKDQYSIPIYQRNYAWEEDQISQLIQDIFDVYKENNNYYLGNLIVYKREHAYESIQCRWPVTLQRVRKLPNIFRITIAKRLVFFSNATFRENNYT